jgi:hypothetical protein
MEHIAFLFFRIEAAPEGLLVREYAKREMRSILRYD